MGASTLGAAVGAAVGSQQSFWQSSEKQPSSVFLFGAFAAVYTRRIYSDDLGRAQTLIAPFESSDQPFFLSAESHLW